MIAYKENPNLDVEVVDTFGGEQEYRLNCRKIQGIYFIKNKEVFNIEGVGWRTVKSGKIEYDHEKKTWGLKSLGLLDGIVGFESNGYPIIGRYTKNVYNNCIGYYEGKIFRALNAEILLSNGYFEDVAIGTYFRKVDMGDSNFKKRSTIRNEISYTNKGYNIEENANEFHNKKQLYAEYPMKISRGAIRYGKFLTDITFGAELECSMGATPEYIQNRHGLVACRDGSIATAGPEWVSIPLQGAKGLQNLKHIGEELSKRNNIDISCSYHLHIGTIPTDRSYIVSLYMLCYEIQEELLKMFPYYKTDPSGIKSKNYCQKLKKMSIYSLKDNSKEGYKQFIDVVYNRIFEFLSDGNVASDSVNRVQMQHPVRNKWDRKGRKFLVNLQNMLFSPRLTAEFRLHSPTTNPQRIINWLFICNAIVKYAEYNMKKVISGERITLVDVLNLYKDHWKKDKDATFLSDYLIAYYNERCEAFKKDFDRNDFVSEWEIRGDKNYKFTYNGVSSLF